MNSALSDKLTTTAPKTQVALDAVTEAARAKLAEERSRKKEEEEMERKARWKEQQAKNNAATGRDAKALDGAEELAKLKSVAQTAQDNQGALAEPFQQAVAAGGLPGLAAGGGGGGV